MLLLFGQMIFFNRRFDKCDGGQGNKRQYQIENSISIDNSNKDVNKDANILSTSLIKSKK